MDFAGNKGIKTLDIKMQAQTKAILFLANNA